MDSLSRDWRKTTQTLMPAQRKAGPPGQYDIYPGFPVGSGKIDLGFPSIADHLETTETAVIDGYVGVFWQKFRESLDTELSRRAIQVAWTDVSRALKPEEQISEIVAPFLGGNDPIFGTRYTGALSDFFDLEALHALKPDPEAGLNILYGCGAALAGWEGNLIYLDLPKNELQFRSRAGRVSNLGTSKPIPPKPMYKRFYFVDWPALNRHKAQLLPRIDLMVDAQRPDEPASMAGDDLRAGLETAAHNYFRVRPWFEPGPWGGHWIEQKIPQLPQDVPNYAWSFELIVPENGLVFESDDHLLEVSFDCLMFQHHDEVLGKAAVRFGTEFPIRFDFLDTVDGGNLSIQCHPRPDFIREHFGESFTQDETYYILDCTDDARVYLGFQQDVDPAAFRAALEQSKEHGTELDVDRYVNSEPSQKHDLFLIPNGTIHSSGAGNMVLEISATPYIFTFKMYDWMRLGLDGKPRPLNIERAFQNLYFDRSRDYVQKKLIAHSQIIAEGQDWQIIHLPTHTAHFYDVVRYEFEREIEADTDGSVHVMSLVEGKAVTLETSNGMRQCFNYAETFVVPAAAEQYRLVNEGEGQAKVVMAFVKPLSGLGT